MAFSTAFKAMVVSETSDGKFVREVKKRDLSELPAGAVLIEVKYSSLNYKDALSATGNKGVTRKYPHTPGIDAAGVVVESASPNFAPGDQVIVTGFDLGANTPGGFGQYVRVPADWPLKLPAGLTLKESMAYGTAGFTAALSVLKMQHHGLTPAQGEILVTGATGGVGSLAIAILARLGFHVVAATGKTGARDFLGKLGAREIISREDVTDTSGRPLLKARWAGVVDTVGGNILATAIRSTGPDGVVASCGNAASADLPLTVYPFILRGVSLLGINSVETPMAARTEIWEKLSREWKVDFSGELVTECPLEDLSPKIDAILKGQIRGRVVVSLI
ncbi:MAG TPA: YhdH/YhfP family quinone oxidoreductase [Candidatus Acidoferrales bacterium]|nr:YhdH/YhfP family quinone oxidoreductase [Candidatus Acidoferrales bacterium]